MREFRELDRVIEFAEDTLRKRPDMSGAELLDELRAMRLIFDRGVERAMCRHCGHPIYNLGSRWQHEGESGNVGCRAASYDRLGTWDEALDQGWKASPAATAR